jgi:hypothetical protein
MGVAPTIFFLKKKIIKNKKSENIYIYIYIWGPHVIILLMVPRVADMEIGQFWTEK